jgi:hypothetical protein
MGAVIETGRGLTTICAIHGEKNCERKLTMVTLNVSSSGRAAVAG